MAIENSNSHGTRPFYYNDLDDPVDSDQQVVNKDLSLSLRNVESPLPSQGGLADPLGFEATSRPRESETNMTTLPTGPP
jgi:hypothetical protein